MYHCLGNHDCNLPREEVCQTLGNPKNAAYFSVKLPRGWRLLVLDTTEVNPRYETPGSDAQVAGAAFVESAKSKPGKFILIIVWANIMTYGFIYLCIYLFSGGAERVKPWGGGLGETQTQWLRRELEAATDGREKVIVASHIALSPTAARPGMSAWRSDEVSQTLESFDCVKVCVAGHDHPGGYGRTLVPDREGKYRTFGRVHYVTLEAMLEAPEGSTSYATMEVYDHEVSVVGVGQATSRRLQTSNDGVFTGVASFGERISDVMDDGGGVGRDGTDGDIVSWINRNAGRMGGPDVEIT